MKSLFSAIKSVGWCVCSMKKIRLLPMLVSHKFFLQVLCSCMAVLLFCLLLITGYTYQNFIKTLENNVEQDVGANLSQVANRLDQEFMLLDDVGLQILENPLFSPRSMRDEHDGYNWMLRSSILATVSGAGLYTRGLFLYCQYSNGNPLIFNESGRWEPQLYGKYIANYEGLSDGHFGALESGTHRKGLIQAKVGEKQQLIYAYSFPKGTSMPESVVVFPIPQEKLSAQFENSGYEGTTFILGEENEILYIHGELPGGFLEESVHDLCLDSLSPQRIEVSGKEYSIFSVASAVGAWHYITVISPSQYLQQYRHELSIFVAVIIVAVFGGLLLSFLLTWRNYSPIRRLVRQYSVNPRASATELEQLAQAMDRMDEREKKLEESLRQSNRYAVSTLMIDLMEHSYPVNEAKSKLEENGIAFAKQTFYVVLVSPDRKANSSIAKRLFSNEMEVVCCEAIQQIIGALGQCYCGVLGGCFWVLLNTDVQANLEDVLATLSRLQIFLEKHIGASVTIAVSKNHNGLENLSLCYDEAKNALAQRFLQGSGKIIAYNDVPVKELECNCFSAEQEESLHLSLRHFDAKKVNQTLSEVFVRLREAGSPIVARYTCLVLVNVVLHEWGIYSEKVGEAYDIEILSGLISVENGALDEFEESFTAFCSMMCEKYVQREHEQKNWQKTLLQFIEEHYANPDLSLESIAGIMELNPVYLTTEFKRLTGYSLMRYIDTLRMEQAKRLLQSTQLTIREIVKEVGYTDVSNFMRKFKKNEGITPTQYRNKETMRKEEHDGTRNHTDFE